MALAGVLCVSGLFAHNNHTHHPFVNNFIIITHIIISSHNHTYLILVIIISLIDHNNYKPRLI